MTAWDQYPDFGEVIADLPTFKEYLGVRTNQDDALLDARLIVAREWVYTRTYVSHWSHNDVQEAVLLLASRLYKRRQAPEGMAGFGGEGGLLRIIAGDPDISDMIERHLDMKQSGIA